MYFSVPLHLRTRHSSCSRASLFGRDRLPFRDDQASFRYHLSTVHRDDDSSLKTLPLCLFPSCAQSICSQLRLESSRTLLSPVGPLYSAPPRVASDPLDGVSQGSPIVRLSSSPSCLSPLVPRLRLDPHRLPEALYGVCKAQSPTPRLSTFAAPHDPRSRPLVVSPDGACQAPSRLALDPRPS